MKRYITLTLCIGLVSCAKPSVDAADTPETPQKPLSVTFIPRVPDTIDQRLDKLTAAVEYLQTEIRRDREVTRAFNECQDSCERYRPVPNIKNYETAFKPYWDCNSTCEKQRPTDMSRAGGC